ncbi:hypothetical protein XELAEV_18043462mg [Xenopus laevis]|uniref:Uncharacterized protein n=1 Tax=Xenopus laevis TaxID=8355 RepID=A0A974BX24_XENLA|nr:hypothetical protein XELAEV_18043462mg [Xenopus laevis]
MGPKYNCLLILGAGRFLQGPVPTNMCRGSPKILHLSVPTVPLCPPYNYYTTVQEGLQVFSFAGLTLI